LTENLALVSAIYKISNHVQKFKKRGLLKRNGEVYAIHISHEGALEHSEFDRYARKHGFRIADDGLTIEI